MCKKLEESDVVSSAKYISDIRTTYYWTSFEDVYFIDMYLDVEDLEGTSIDSLKALIDNIRSYTYSSKTQRKAFFDGLSIGRDPVRGYSILEYSDVMKINAYLRDNKLESVV